MAKLTLSIDEQLIDSAKQKAAQNNTSISAMVGKFLQSLTDESRLPKIGPLTKKASGIAKLDSNQNYKDLVTDALLDKYGL